MVPYCYKDSDWWSYEDVYSARTKVKFFIQSYNAVTYMPPVMAHGLNQTLVANLDTVEPP